MRYLTLLSRYFLLVACLSIFHNSASAQSAGGQLGDATVTPGSSTIAGPYGMNSTVESASSGNFETRHRRAGNEGGIGGSFLSTEAVTAESRPLSRSQSAVASPAVSLPTGWEKPRSFSEQMMYTPALLSPSSSNPVSTALSKPRYTQTESTNNSSIQYNEFWGHQKPWGSTQPTSDSFRGSDLLQK